jgi:hypothetical protein
MLKLRGLKDNGYIYELKNADPANVVPKRFGTYKLTYKLVNNKDIDIPITELVDVDYNKINESNPTLTNEDDGRTYKIKIKSINTVCKDWKSSSGAECTIIFEGVPKSSGGRRRSKKRPSARRRRSSKARKARKSRTTRHR